MNISTIICRKSLSTHTNIVFFKYSEYKYHKTSIGYRVYDELNNSYLYSVFEFKEWFISKSELRKEKLKQLKKIREMSVLTPTKNK